MTRAFAAVVLTVLAAVALAQVPAQQGEVLEVNNFDAGTDASYINSAHCARSDDLDIEWNTVLVSGASFSATGNFRIIASNTAPATSGDDVNFCPEEDDTNASPPVSAGQVKSVAASTVVQGTTVSGADVASEANVPCDAANEGKVVYVCSHWYDASAVRKGHASGRFIIQVAAPAPPTNVSAGPGNGRLIVTWDASTGGDVDADHYVAFATPVAGGATVASGDATATTVTIDGLTNHTEYRVVVRAFSIGGNPSGDSEEALGTPVPSAGFWDVCEERGCVEEGGCATGSADMLALLASASLLAIRRRKP